MRGRCFLLLVAVGVTVMAGGFAACGGGEFSTLCDGDDCSDGAPDGGDGVDAATCDSDASPAEEPCTIDERLAVFVSPRGDDAVGKGDREAPFRTLSKAMVEARAAGKRLYACDDGTGYGERLVVDGDLDGLVAYGGFDCDGWSYGDRKAIVQPSEPGVALRIDGLSQGLFLRDFAIRAADATAPGQSSIGVLVNASTSVVFEAVDIVAGKGRDGADAVEESAPAAPGKDGNAGAKACAASPNRGGGAANHFCGPAATTGGRGGDGGEGIDSAGNGNVGLPSSMKGGKEGVGQGSSACVAGQGGADGDVGKAGAGASGLGTLDAEGWTGIAGTPGTSGGVGQGGGGGGGAKAPAACNGLAIPTGASGGSGGAGGCGGRGGEGGSAGGASIALVSLDSEVELRECTLSASDGGRGGNGARGQKGGAGGSAGTGGQGANGSVAACNGGNGGRGGDGGPGGGGAGGHSLGIAFVGTKPVRSGGAIELGTAGLGGEPGEGGAAAGKGANGRRAEELEF